MKPLCIDLFCGLGGWAEGFIPEGYEVVGFDIERHDYGSGGYPGQLVLQDVLTLNGSQFRGAAVIVASPPCEDFSRWDQPWPNVIKNRKEPDLSLWRAAERIASEAGVPVVIENVRGAQIFMGPARAHFGKQFLWGNVPALLPHIGVGVQNFGRQKQALPSSRRLERAKIPFPLASHIARCFKP